MEEEIRYINGAFIGHIFPDDAGYYVFSPLKHQGWFEEHILRLIADQLLEKNKKWDKEIQETFQEKNGQSGDWNYTLEWDVYRHGTGPLTFYEE